MKTKHTPGPWHRDKEYPIYVWGPGQKMVADLPSPMDGDEDTYLVRMRGVGRGATREEQDANCTLISAAPELLDVVTRFRQKLATYVHVYPGDSELRRLLKDCDAAIAKAEPRT